MELLKYRHKVETIHLLSKTSVTKCGGTNRLSVICAFAFGIVSLFGFAPLSVHAQSPQSVVLKNEKGGVVYRLESGSNGGRLLDGADKEVAQFNRKDESKRRVLVIKKGNAPLGFIASKHSGKWEIYDQNNTMQFVFKQEEAGYKLKSSDEQSLFRIKPRPYGMEVETSDDKSQYKTRVDTTGIRFENNQGKLVYSAPARQGALMISCFGLDKLSIEQKGRLILRRGHDEVVMQDETDLESGCPLLIGFLFKRRCGKKDRTGCAYCKGVALAEGVDLWAPERDPYFTDRSLYPNYQKYDWWVSDKTGSVDFFDADGVTLLNDDSDFEFELDPEAS